MVLKTGLQERDWKMSEKVVSAGLDVSKQWIDAAIWRPGLRDRCLKRFEQTAEGYQALGAWLTEHQVGRVGLEASGGYEVGPMDALQALGFEVFRLNAQRVRQFAKAKGRLAKTDKVDAWVIAQAVVVLPDEEAQAPQRRRDLDALVEYLTYRRRLLDWITDCANQLEHLTNPTLRENVSADRARFRTQVIALDKTLAALVAQAGPLSDLAKRLRTAKGVGPVLAQTLIALLPELGQVSRQAIASLAGVAPFDDDSGKRVGERHIKGGRQAVRDALYMAALSAMRHNPPIKALAERLAGKKPKVIIVACMRKLLVILNAMVRDGQDWRDPAKAT